MNQSSPVDMMDDDSAPPDSPPLPKKGAYSIDFDAIDENTNPFVTKSKIGFGSSPPLKATVPDSDDIDSPFKPRTTLRNSPPGSPKASHSSMTTDFADSETTDTLNHTDCAPYEEDNVSNNAVKNDANESKPRVQSIPKKKKIVKKPKAQSKLRPPRAVPKQQDESDEIQIFMPGINADNSNQVPEPQQEIVNNVGNSCESPSVAGDEGEPPLDAAPEAMATSLETDHRFVEGEEGDNELVNEGFAAPPEEYKDAKDWSLLNSAVDMDKQDKENGKEEETDERRAKPSRDSAEHRRKSTDNAILRQSPLPQPENSEGNRTKHPAARALEAVQAESVPGQGKCESSSDEGQFYDAYEYPPPPTSQTSSGGQTISDTMEKSVDDGQKDQNKGTVVQLVQESGNNQVLRYSQSDWNKMKQELELNYQTSLLNKERDWSLLLADRDKKIASLSDNCKKLKATNEDMRMVVAEFEKTISQLQADKEKAKSESHKAVHDLEQERDQALEDLQSVETAFSDLHRRYEKSKSIIEGFKRNEGELKSCVEDLQGKLKKSEVKLLSLRSQAEEKLDRANEDIDKIKKSTRSEVVRLEAALKKAELRNSSLEESLQRKEKENQELTAICDELIAKVGS